MNLQLQIEKLVYGGDGLSRLDGEVIFTPFVLPGEKVDVERTEARKHVQRTRLLRVDEPSPDRVEAPCPVFGRCGGCQYQHAGYDAQLRFKREILAETLRRVGKIEFDAGQIADRERGTVRVSQSGAVSFRERPGWISRDEFAAPGRGRAMPHQFAEDQRDYWEAEPYGAATGDGPGL